MENDDDKHSIPVLDGELVSGHVKGGARVRGYALIRYLPPPPEKEHPDFYHTCHEFVPEESAMLDAHGTPILFNHKGKLGLCGQTIVDHEAEDGSGARYGLIAVHGEGDLAGEAFSDYLGKSIQKGRYTKVSLQHAYWLDSSAPNGVRKKALEISICKKNGRRAGAEIISYEPALEKRSYIKSGKGVRGVSCASLSSSSTSETKTTTTSTPSRTTLSSMEVDSPQQQQQQSSTSTPPSTQQQQQQQQQQQKQEEEGQQQQQVPDISKKTPIEMMEMTTKTMEEKKRALEEKSKLEQLVKEQAVQLEELKKFQQQKLQEEAEKKRLEQEALEKAKMEQKTKIKDMAKSLWTAFSEQLEQQGEDGQSKPLIDEKEQQDQMEIIDSFNDEQLAAFNKFVMCTSAATETVGKRLREQQEQAARMEEELKRQKMGHLQERFNSAYSSSASSKTQVPLSSSSSPSYSASNSLNHPTARFNNLPQTMGKTVIQEAASLNLFSMPKIVPRGGGGGGVSEKKEAEPPKTQEEAIRAYNEWFAENAGKVDRKTAEQALQSMVGTSAASADGGGGGSYGMYGPPPVSMTIQHTSQAAWERIIQHMDKKHDSVLACRIVTQ